MYFITSFLIVYIIVAFIFSIIWQKYNTPDNIPFSARIKISALYVLYFPVIIILPIIANLLS